MYLIQPDYDGQIEPNKSAASIINYIHIYTYYILYVLMCIAQLLVIRHPGVSANLGASCCSTLERVLLLLLLLLHLLLLLLLRLLYYYYGYYDYYYYYCCYCCYYYYYWY